MPSSGSFTADEAPKGAAWPSPTAANSGETLAATRARKLGRPEGSVMEAILEVVERLNAAWPAGEFDQLVGVFDPGVVLVAFSPAGAHRVVGRDAVIRSYREFVGQSVLYRFELKQPAVDVFGTTAIATCPYTIEYEIGGRRWIGNGQNLLVLNEGHKGWKVVCRSLFPGEEEEVGPGRAQEA